MWYYTAYIVVLINIQNDIICMHSKQNKGDYKLRLAKICPYNASNLIKHLQLHLQMH